MEHHAHVVNGLTPRRLSPRRTDTVSTGTDIFPTCGYRYTKQDRCGHHSTCPMSYAAYNVSNQFSPAQFARRTALTRAKKGGFRDTPSESLIYATLKSGLEISGLDPACVEDIVVGTWIYFCITYYSLRTGTCHPPSPCYEIRAACLASGFPVTTPSQSVNRLCGSGLMVIRHISDSIRTGDIEIGIAAGYESMSHQ